MIKKVIKNVVSKMKEDSKSICNAVITTATALAVSCLGMPMSVMAAGGYTAPLDNLKTILVTIAGSAGVILVVYGGIRFAIAFQKMDQNGEHSAIYTIIAGGVLIGLSAVLGVLGV